MGISTANYQLSTSTSQLPFHSFPSISFASFPIFPIAHIPNHSLSKWRTDVSLDIVFFLNDQRTARVADLLSDFRTLQYYIAAAPVDPDNQDDYASNVALADIMVLDYTEGYAALRQCSIDGQHILNCAAETRVPRV